MHPVLQPAGIITGLRKQSGLFMMSTLLLMCLVVAGAAATDDSLLLEEKVASGVDYCRLAGSFCGTLKCSPRSDHGSFACDCGKQRYFNATAQRCFRVFSCPSHECTHSECVDDDGNSTAKCVCKEGPHITRDCQEKPTYRNECVALGGKLQLAESGEPTVMPHCVCRPGTRLANGTCHSVACLFPNFSCEKICSDLKLREDSRCCQGWNATSCNDPHLTEQYCKPGSVWNSAESRCENACLAGLSETLCKHGCQAANRFTANYTCSCADDEELSDDGVTCTAKTKCNEHEQKKCSETGRQCVVDAGKPRCRCQENTIELTDSCSEACTEAKARECSTPLSWCVIKNYTEKCFCQPPLRWNYTSRQCVPDNEYKYVFDFRENANHKDAASNRCNDTKMATDVQNAMKNLYGSDLKSTRVIKCGETVTMEVTFSSEPPSPVLRMVRLCEVSFGTVCLFPPSLRIVKGSVSDPVPVDMCVQYFHNITQLSSGLYYCTKGAGGQFVLRCSGGNVTESIHRGLLELQICHGKHIYGNCLLHTVHE
ncbi:hypothetical protein V5799_015583 [Amblyomma americanum]|uniref:EGF-like domain-containing protein n=1 Tax=Amblyomma americanum TaxID=6943 RepID=A0AAQ4F8K8_AMBAM